HLAQQLDAHQSSADHHEGEAAASRRNLRLRIRALELLDESIAQHERIRHGLEGERRLGSGNQLQIRRCAERDDEMVIWNVVAVAPGNRMDDACVDVHAVYHCLDESGFREGGADGLRAVPQLERSRARLEEERREHEEVVATHERDLDVGAVAEQTLELAHGRDAGEAAAEHDDAYDRWTVHPVATASHRRSSK